MSSILKVLRNRNFLFLWIGQLISQFGDCLGAMALIGLVYSRQDNPLDVSSVEYAKLFVFVIIPVFIIGPVAGVYVDRWDRRRVMITCDVIRGILVALIPLFLFFTRSMLLVYISVFLIYSSTRFFLPSKLAIIPDLVSKDKLLVANSLTATTRTFALIFSFALAGALVKLVGWRTSFYIDSMTYFISAVFISIINLTNVMEELKKDISRARDVLKEAMKRDIISEIKEGILYLRRHREVRFVASIFFALMSGIGAISVVLIVFIQKNFGTATWHLSFFASFLALGVLLGSLAYGKYGQKVSKIKAIFTSFILSGLSLALFSKLINSFTDIMSTAIMALIFGLVFSPIVIGLYTLLHQKVPSNLRGKTFSVIEIVIHAGFLISMFLSALLAEYVREMWIVIIVGVIFAIWGALGLIRTPIDIENIT